MSELDLAPLRTALTPFAPHGRTALLPALHAAQKIYGWLPEPVAAEVGHALQVPLADVYGVIDFYSLFYREPVGQKVIQVCGDPVCALAGADEVLNAICQHLRIQPGQMSADGSFSVERATCLGLCEHAPAVLKGETALGRAEPARAADLIAGTGTPPGGIVGGDLRRLTLNCGRGRATTLPEYEASGGYAA